MLESLYSFVTAAHKQGADTFQRTFPDPVFVVEDFDCGMWHMWAPFQKLLAIARIGPSEEDSRLRAALTMAGHRFRVPIS